MKCILVTIFICLSTSLSAQTDEIDYAVELAQLEAELDSFSIFNLIDSLLTSTAQTPSEWNIRFGYTSNILSAGRNFGIEQHGFSPGISYYHRSGMFADFAGFWNSANEPKYNLTMLTVGYMGLISGKWSYSLSYEKWFYNLGASDSSQISFSNGLGASVSYDMRWLNTSFDYSFLFGNSTAHRLIWSTSGDIRIKNFWIFDRVRIYPTFSMIIGNGDVTSFRFTDDEAINTLYDLSTATAEELEQYRTLVRRQRRAGEITNEQARNTISLINFLEENGELPANLQQQLEEELFVYSSSSEFGLLNYGFSLPVSFQKRNWSLLVSYSYSIPVSLPGEAFELNPIGYFGATLSLRVPTR
ncbi:MAG: hypothetical protein KI790_14955 [Cyclobacteriaceae bacterium]|nr:hypothetical protein [Cyclobacteriaceae bacterium HetDA_MAG_MS6]